MLQAWASIDDSHTGFRSKVLPFRSVRSNPSLLSYLEASRRICVGKQRIKSGTHRRRTENYDFYGCEIGGNVIAAIMLSANDDSSIRDGAD